MIYYIYYKIAHIFFRRLIKLHEKNLEIFFSRSSLQLFITKYYQNQIFKKGMDLNEANYFYD